MRAPSDSAAAAADILRRGGGRWALIGALAALRYRRTERLTTDADFLADHVDGLEVLFEAAGYDVEVFQESGEDPHMLTARGHGDHIDVLFPAVAYQEEALARATDHVLTVEDVIVHKLIAWRSRDQSDVLSILETNPQLDEPYIERWAAEWQVLDRWELAKRSR